MTLNVCDGILVVGKLKFRPDSEVTDYSGFEVKEINPVSGYKSVEVRTPEEGVMALDCYFKDGLIQWVNIYLVDDDPLSPPFEVSERQRRQAYERVKVLGGENAYDWGQVSVSEDRKGGQTSIVISYRTCF